MRGVKSVMCAAALALLPMPTLAQQGPADMVRMGEAMAEMIAPPPPLTPEQQARLPVAQALAEKVLPAGSLNSAMGGMFVGFLPQVAADAAPDPRNVVSRRLGIYSGSTELSDQQAQRIADLLDPQWTERERRERALTGQLMGRMMDTVEPLMRQALAELYAIHFDAAQLADIDGFFATPSGAAYARQSYLMASDPRMTGTMMAVLPQAFQQVAAMETETAAATADLPPQRNLADLSSNQRKALAQMLGIAVEDLEYALPDVAP